MKLVKQHDDRDCAAACLAMIARYYGTFVPLSTCRELTKTDKSGASIKGIIDGAKAIGLEAEALEGDYDEFLEAVNSKELSFPLVVHTLSEQNTLHFIVIEKFNGGTFSIYDPGAGISKQHPDEFAKKWTGYVVSFEKAADFHPQRISSKSIHEVIRAFKEHSNKLGLIVLFSGIISAIGIAGACIFQVIIDHFVSEPGSSSDIIHMITDFLRLNSTNISVIFPAIIALYILQGGLQLIRGYLLTEISRDIDTELTMRYYEHLLELPVSSLNVRQTGEYLSRFSDISIIRDTISNITITLILDVVMVVGCGVILANQNIVMFSVTLIMVMMYALVILLYKGPLSKYNQKVMEDDAVLHSYLKEVLDGMETVKGSNAETEAYGSMKKRFTKYMSDQFHTSILAFSQDSLSLTIQLIGTALILWIGFSLTTAKVISIGSLMSYYVLLGYFTEPIKNLIGLQPELQSAFIAIERLGDVLDLSVEQNTNLKALPDTIREWSFQHVDFRYGTQELLFKNLSFQLKKGEKVAVVGESGSGKTTVAKLLMGFYSPEEGHIFADSIDINSIDSKELRKRIAYVDQNTFLFSDTIKNNLKLGNPDISDEAIVQACKQSMAHEFIMKMPLGYDTPLAENGMNLSGGQRQRLAIARALLKKPELLILDEATSSLDTITEDAIKNTIFSLSDDLTCIIIAHRLNTIQQCDRILLFEDGCIIEEGTHEELLLFNGKYSSLWNTLA